MSATRTKKPNTWVAFVKEFASKNSMSYACAMTDPKAKEEYKKSKEPTPVSPVAPVAPAPEPTPAPTPALTKPKKWTKYDEQNLKALLKTEAEGKLKDRILLDELLARKKLTGRKKKTQQVPATPTPAPAKPKWTKNDEADLKLLLKQQEKGTLKDRSYLDELLAKKQMTGGKIGPAQPKLCRPYSLFLKDGQLFCSYYD